jgi:hypothetical protein
MANLTYADKIYLEDYLKMTDGWLLDFSNNSLNKFVFGVLQIDIYDNKYDNFGSSKANRIRAVWDIENDYNIGKLISEFIKYYQAKRISNSSFFNATEELELKCVKITELLLKNGVSNHIDLIQATTDENDFIKLASIIRTNIENNDPESALDRLHTFYVKFIRDLCLKNSITFNESETLNAIFGKYLRYIEQSNLLESEMTKSILKYSINVIEKYNDVRNNRSFAHDNKILNYHESLYIFDTLARLKGFIDNLQTQLELTQNSKEIEF